MKAKKILKYKFIVVESIRLVMRGAKQKVDNANACPAPLIWGNLLVSSNVPKI